MAGAEARDAAAQFCEERGLADTRATLPNCGWHGIIERDIAFKLERSPAYARLRLAGRAVARLAAARPHPVG